MNVDQLFATYDAALRDVADQLAPSHVIRRRPGRPTPWFDAECRALRRDCRRLERRFRRTQCPMDRQAWVQATRHRFQTYRAKKENYWLGRLMQCGRSTPLQWRSLSSILGRHCDVTESTSHTAEGFARYFKKKIDDIRSATAGIPQPEVCSRATSSLATLQSFAEADVRRIIMSSPIKSCSLDPVPTFLLREFVDLLLPYATRMVNASLEEGRLPISQRHAIVTPLLKRPGLDTADMFV